MTDMAKSRPRPGQPPAVGSETEVGMPQTVGVRAGGGALERTGAPPPPAFDDEVDTVHAHAGLDPIPVATPVGTPVLPPGPFDVPASDESSESTMLPADEPTSRPTEAVASRARTGTAASSRRTAAASGRRSSVSARNPTSGRTSRKLSATSGRSSSEGGLGSLLWIALGILAAAVAVVAVILLATHRSEARQHGNAALAEAQHQLDSLDNALAAHRPVEARRAYVAGLAALTGEPSLGGAATPLPVGDKRVVVDLAQRALGLRTELEAKAAAVTAAEALAAVDSNLAAMRNRFARLGDAATDLDALDHDAKAYCDNPVDPKASADPAAAATYQQQVSEVRLRIPEIATERNRRRIERVVVPVDRLRPAIADLLNQERYGDALARIAEAKAKAPEADFGQLTDEVNNTAANAWQNAKHYAETRLADWKSPGTTAEQRTRAVADARKRLRLVIDTYGVPDYVDQAKSMLSSLP